MRALLVPIGSAGDVHPFVGIALALQARGHDVTLASNPSFAPLVGALGLPFVPLGTVEQFEQVKADPGLWRPHHGPRVVMGAATLGAAETHEAVVRHVAAGPAVVVAHPLAFGARMAHETHGVPLVTIQLAPAAFWSVEHSPILGPEFAAINALPRPLKRFVYAVGSSILDLTVAPALNRVRAEYGLPPVRRIVGDWWHSPQRIIGLFPDWFAPPQPDWPPHLALSGFPRFDERGVTALPPGVDRFLDEAEAAGDPPIVWAPGSANRQASRFFAAAVDACRRLGRRGLLLTPHPEQVPSPLPAGVRHAAYVPFSALLPRVAALVHHGGIGTLAQGLAAGRPHLVMPMGFDQFDNAARLVRLGVGRVLRPRRFTGPAVARELAALLDSDAVAERCAAVARRFEGIDPVARTCDLIEQFADESGQRAGLADHAGGQGDQSIQPPPRTTSPS